MTLNLDQEQMYLSVEATLNSMKPGEVKRIKPEHPAYNNFLKCCNYIRSNGEDIKNNYHLIISPEEIRKETLEAYKYICRLEEALNKKLFLR